MEIQKKFHLKHHTTELENKLRKIFNEAEQTGGAKRKRKSKKVSVTEDGKKEKESFQKKSQKIKKASKKKSTKNQVKKLKELPKKSSKNLPKRKASKKKALKEI